MATPSNKLAESLTALKALQDAGAAAVRSRDLSRTHRERLLQSGFLKKAIKGWYIFSRPDEMPGESTAWYIAYWPFCAQYLQSRFGDAWCLSPEQSLSLHAGNWSVPKQLLVRATRPRGNITLLPQDTSLLEVKASLPKGEDVELLNGLRVFSLPAALLATAPSSYQQTPHDIRAALTATDDASDLLRRLLKGGHSTIAGRLAGAFRNIGREDVTDNIMAAMKAAGYKPVEVDPFKSPSAKKFNRKLSPYVSRVQLLWQGMRRSIISAFPPAPGPVKDKAKYLEQIDELFTQDAYHSLSIEGYRVGAELIERVKSGDWSPDTNEEDRNQRDALAARGYWLAFQRVRGSIGKILDGENPGAVARQAHHAWYRELFAPGIEAKMYTADDLSGYRNGPVYIRNSQHVPPSKEAVRDLMPAFFDLLEAETHPAARVVLGHFVFVNIHPYMDGNGRIGRFLMNAMLAGGGYSWTVVPVQKRDEYMRVLEAASVDGDIEPFASFLGGLVRGGISDYMHIPLRA